MEEAHASIESGGAATKPQVIYRCKKCRRIVATQENVVPHERGEGEKCFKWTKRNGSLLDTENKLPDCSSIFVEPMKWMQPVEDGHVEEKLLCLGCKARLGSFNWAGISVIVELGLIRHFNCTKVGWMNLRFESTFVVCSVGLAEYTGQTRHLWTNVV